MGGAGSTFRKCYVAAAGIVPDSSIPGVYSLGNRLKVDNTLQPAYLASAFCAQRVANPRPA